MTRNLVVCCDGTGNRFGLTNTNVIKLYQVLVQDDEQIAYYHPGLGTMGSPVALTKIARLWTRLLGLAVGYGLTGQIAEAYGFLMDNYVPGDRVFLFGFSRGAYVVRSLAAALHMFGLLRRGNRDLVPYLVDMFRAKKFQVAPEFKRTFSLDCKPHFVGVWDTVSSVGWFYDPVRLPYTFNNPDIQIGRHAVSIDERRCFFRQNLMGDGEPHQDISQVWFAGVHCDVGGGYPEAESGLSNIALDWMLEEAGRAGLRLDPEKRGRLGRPDPRAEAHRSLRGAWWILEFLPRPVVSLSRGTPRRIVSIAMGRRRKVREGAVLHPSVFERRKALGSAYDPPNLRDLASWNTGMTDP